MTHIPLKVGEEYTLANGSHATITSIGKSCKRAYSDNCGWWHVETGEHRRDPALDTTGRVEPAPGQTITIKAFSLADDETPPKAPRECWMHDGVKRVRMIDAAPIEADLARVTAERDEAVALLRIDPWNIGYADWTGRCRAFLAKIGGKP